MEEVTVTTDQSTVTIEIPTDAVTSTANPTEPISNQQIAEMAHPSEISPSTPQESADSAVKVEEKPKSNAGRPCEYCKRKEEIDRVTEKYIADCRRAREARKPVIPYIEDLADKLDVDYDTMTNWAAKTKEDGELEHPLFFGALKKLKNLQKLLLLQRTNARYQPTGAIFQLKANHGLIETEKKILAGSETEPLDIRVIEDRPTQ